jgi:hypothetical protein
MRKGVIMNKVAFIITVYKNDNTQFFKEAIESIINQNYGVNNINIYLGIDGEIPDMTKTFIEENNNFFYKIVQNKTNKGLAFTLNRLIDLLENEEFIFRMDSDDICAKNRVSKQLFLKENKDILLLGSDLIEIDKNGNELKYKKMPKSSHDIYNYSIARNPFNHPTVVLRKDFFSLIGKYNETLLKSQDYELWARALKKRVKCSNINEALLYFRIDDNYMKKRNSIVNYINELKISLDLMWHFKKFSQFPKILVKFLLRILPSSIGQYAYNKIRK